MNTLNDATVSNLLDRLFADSLKNDEPIMERLKDVLGSGPLDDQLLAHHLSTAYISVDRHAGRLLYMLAKMHRSRIIVEFGTSFGISTIHLAAAVRDNGGGRVITSEQVPEKVRRAKEHLTEAGLVDLVDFREGDALQTLADLDEPIDMLFLDGWKPLYLPVLNLLEGKLKPGAIIVADDLNVLPEMIQPYLDFIRDPAHGYDSIEVPIGDGLELSIRSL